MLESGMLYIILYLCFSNLKYLLNPTLTLYWFIRNSNFLVSKTPLAFLIVVNQCLVQFSKFHLSHKSCLAINHKKRQVQVFVDEKATAYTPAHTFLMYSFTFGLIWVLILENIHYASENKCHWWIFFFSVTVTTIMWY